MATTDKYDRQLRLWGASGQRKLGESRILLIRATAAGTETAKNLILPGIGAVHILDDGKEQADRSNFFAVNDPQSVCENLQELNPDVKMTIEHVDSIVVTTETLQGFTMILASDLEPTLLKTTSQIAESLQIPLLVITSYGLIGALQVQAPKLVVMEPKSKGSLDLHLAQPFPELQALVDSIDLSSCDSQQHGHVPYPILLVQARQQYQATHGKIPTTFAEKQDFAALLKSMARDYQMEINFQQAVSNAYLAYTKPSVDLDSLEHAGLDELQVLARAVREFVKLYGALPVNGNLPDMTSSTELYVRLQEVYQRKQAQDRTNFRQLLAGAPIEDSTIDLFCENLRFLEIVCTGSIHGEPQPDPVDEDEINPENPLYWFLGIQGCRVFWETHGRYPGTTEDYEADVPVLLEITKQVFAKTAVSCPDFIDKMCQELTRYGNAEIHTIASVVGGVAAQEAVKLITNQYIPISNTYVFNGITSTGGVYQL